MAYNSNIPQPGDRLKDSQSDLLENFLQISTVFSVDHATFNSQLGQGKHRQVTFPVNAAIAPGPTEIRMYSNTSAFSGVPEIFLAKGADPAVEFTTSKKSEQGYTMTPAGLLIKWGNVDNASAAGGPFDFIWPATPSDIPFNTQIWATIVVGGPVGGVLTRDVNAIIYIESIADPSLITYRVFRRNQANTPGTNQGPFKLWALAFGTVA